jgi:hypothetical protein
MTPWFKVHLYSPLAPGHMLSRLVDGLTDRCRRMGAVTLSPRWLFGGHDGSGSNEDGQL